MAAKYDHRLILLLVLSFGRPAFANEWPTAEGKVGVQTVWPLDSREPGYQRLYLHSGVKDSLSLPLFSPAKTVTYNVQFRGWWTHEYVDSTTPSSSIVNPGPLMIQKDLILTEQNSLIAEYLIERATLEYNHRRWRFRIGQQELSLGEVLGPSVIDLASPRDYRQADQFLKSSQKIPQLMGSMEYKRSSYGLQLYVSPRPQTMMLPRRIEGLPLYDATPTDEPEFGGRSNYFIGGFDLKLFAMHHQNRSPILTPQLGENGPEILALQRYENSYGSTLSYAWEQSVLRAEMVRTIAEHRDMRDLSFQKMDQAVVAYDYTTDKQLLIIGQLQTLLPYACKASPRCSNRQIWGGIQLQRPWLDELLKTNLFLYRRLDQQTLFQKSEIEWNSPFRTQWKLSFERYLGFEKDNLAFLDRQDRFLFDIYFPF